MDWTIFTTIAIHILGGLPLFAVALLVLILGRLVFLRTTSFNAHAELFDKRNPAYAVALGAYLLGAALALSGTFFGSREDDSLIAAGKLCVNGSLVIVLLRASLWVNDRFILSTFSIAKEIGEDRNLGVGFCVAGSCLACGLILNGAMTGYSKDFIHGLRDVVFFWGLGQAAMVAACAAYRRTVKYEVHRLIEYDDNTAVGLGFGGFLVAMGIVLRSALLGAGRGTLGQELTASAFLAVAASLLLVLVQAVTLRLLFPKTNYEDEVEMNGNVAVAIIAAGTTVAVAMLLASIIQRGAA